MKIETDIKKIKLQIKALNAKFNNSIQKEFKAIKGQVREINIRLGRRGHLKCVDDAIKILEIAKVTIEQKMDYINNIYVSLQKYHETKGGTNEKELDCGSDKEQGSVTPRIGRPRGRKNTSKETSKGS